MMRNYQQWCDFILTMTNGIRINAQYFGDCKGGGELHHGFFRVANYISMLLLVGWVGGRDLGIQAMEENLTG